MADQFVKTACSVRTGCEGIKGCFADLLCIFMHPKLNCAYVLLQTSLSHCFLLGTQMSSKILLFIGNSKDI